MGITKSNVINNFINRVVTPAYNSCVYWNTYNPGTTRMDTSKLAGRDVTRPTTGNLPSNIITAVQIRDMANSYAVNTTAYRRARSGLMGDNGAMTDDRTDVCRLLDTYRITYTTPNVAMVAGQVASQTNENNYFNAVRVAYDDAQLNAAVVDLRVCHSSCHTSCHGSRGRR